MTGFSTSDSIIGETGTYDYPLVSIIVLNFNGLERLKACFDSVIRQGYPNYEIIFVDNGSSDGSLDWVREKLANSAIAHRIEALHSNLGINRGKNHGASLARGKYLWLLDNDIAPEISALGRLVAFMEEHEDVALCGATLTDFSNPEKIVGGGIRLRMLNGPLRPLNSTVGYAGIAPLVTYISGGIMFVRANIWRELGGFEENARFYLDDTDFGVRCWLAGYKVALVDGCHARHWNSLTGSAAATRLRFRQRITGVTRFILRNFSLFPLITHLASFEATLIVRTVRRIIRDRQPELLLDYIAAQYHCLVGIRDTLRQRSLIQRSRRIPGDVFLHLKDRDNLKTTSEIAINKRRYL